MTMLRALFAGEVKKADHKEVGGKKLVELSICKKNRGAAGAEESFTWIRISVWEPAAWQIPLLARGCFVAGSGDMQLRGFEGKNGKAYSLECRCTSFDLEISAGTGSEPVSHEAPPRTPRAPTSTSSPESDDEPPF